MPYPVHCPSPKHTTGSQPNEEDNGIASSKFRALRQASMLCVSKSVQPKGGVVWKPAGPDLDQFVKNNEHNVSGAIVEKRFAIYDCGLSGERTGTDVDCQRRDRE